MEDSTDLYAILGILPNADEAVIRAAYRVLAQRYRADRWPGDAAEAAARLKRIEEAYGTLSDPDTRREYDQRAATEAVSAEFGEQAEPENVMDAPGWRADWDLVCRFYPRLRDVESQFRAISPALAFTFCATLLESKRFPDADPIARQMEQAYLGKYFGNDPEILAFAKRLIVAGNAETVHTLSRALRVLGPSTPASLVIETLSRELDAATDAGTDEFQEDPLDAEDEAGEPDTVEVEPEVIEAADEAVADDEMGEEGPDQPAVEVEAAPEVEEPHGARSRAAASAPRESPAEAPKPAARGTPETAKSLIKDPKKRASVQSFLRAYRAGEGLDLDSAVSLVRAMEGMVNLKKAEAQFGDTRVEVRFRGQNIMFGSGEFLEWVQRKLLPEVLAKM